MSILSEKITSLNLESKERNAQVLEICGMLNAQREIPSIKSTNYKLKPLLIPHLIEEGIVEAAKLQTIATHPICSDFLKALVKEHYNGATELSSTIEQLVAAGRTFGVLTETDAQAVRDRLDLAKVMEADRGKPIDQRRYEEWIEEIPQPPVSWSQANLGRTIGGDEVLEILGELYGSEESV